MRSFLQITQIQKIFDDPFEVRCMLSVLLRPEIEHKNDVRYIPIQTLGKLEKDNMWNFQISDLDTQKIVITIAETNDKGVHHLASTEIPLKLLEFEKKISSKYVLEPKHQNIQPLETEIELFLTNNENPDFNPFSLTTQNKEENDQGSYDESSEYSVSIEMSTSSSEPAANPNNEKSSSSFSEDSSETEEVNKEQQVEPLKPDITPSNETNPFVNQQELDAQGLKKRRHHHRHHRKHRDDDQSDLNKKKRKHHRHKRKSKPEDQAQPRIPFNAQAIMELQQRLPVPQNRRHSISVVSKNTNVVNAVQMTNQEEQDRHHHHHHQRHDKLPLMPFSSNPTYGNHTEAIPKFTSCHGVKRHDVDVVPKFVSYHGGDQRARLLGLSQTDSKELQQAMMRRKSRAVKNLPLLQPKPDMSQTAHVQQPSITQQQLMLFQQQQRQMLLQQQQMQAQQLLQQQQEKLLAEDDPEFMTQQDQFQQQQLQLQQIHQQQQAQMLQQQQMQQQLYQQQQQQSMHRQQLHIPAGSPSASPHGAPLLPKDAAGNNERRAYSSLVKNLPKLPSIGENNNQIEESNESNQVADTAIVVPLIKTGGNYPVVKKPISLPPMNLQKND